MKLFCASCAPVLLKSVAVSVVVENCDAFTKPMFVRYWAVLRMPVMKSLSRPAPEADFGDEVVPGDAREQLADGRGGRGSHRGDRVDAALDADVAVVRVQAGARIRSAVRAGLAGVEDELAESVCRCSVLFTKSGNSRRSRAARVSTFGNVRLRPCCVPVAKITETSTESSLRFEMNTSEMKVADALRYDRRPERKPGPQRGSCWPSPHRRTTRSPRPRPTVSL